MLTNIPLGPLSKRQLLQHGQSNYLTKSLFFLGKLNEDSFFIRKKDCTLKEGQQQSNVTFSSLCIIFGCCLCIGHDNDSMTLFSSGVKSIE